LRYDRQGYGDGDRQYLKKFGETRPGWYVFPFGKPQPTDPTRPATSFQTVWATIKKATPPPVAQKQPAVVPEMDDKTFRLRKAAIFADSMAKYGKK